MGASAVLYLLVLTSALLGTDGKQNTKSSVDDVHDAKEFKKILRTKNNVMVYFLSSLKEGAETLKMFKEAADVVKGQGSMLLVDCSGEGKKLCKKFKVGPEPYSLRHYKDGEFHKDYDRKMSASSLISFMRDPTGEIPWEEDDKTVDVVHLLDPGSFVRLIKKETRPIMVMFYAPWCGFCKLLKPEYSEAASALKGTHILAAIDVNRPENMGVRLKYNITGFPTLLYFNNGEMKYTYEAENTKAEIIKFMKDPTSAPSKPKDEDWSDQENDVIHLTVENFDEILKNEESILVMFYAPWCGHCKKAKPEYEKAATHIKIHKIKGTIAALDATKEGSIAKRFGVKGYPTIKYFKNGEFAYDTPQLRETNAIIDFMRDPKQPPPPPPPEPAWEDIESEVKHLNVENFKVILKKKKHAIVMFYAPWCGHCKMAKPEFQEAAEELKDDSKVVFAAVDCTKHSSLCQTAGVIGYPTIKYYNYYNKEPSTDYSGGRKKADFVSYMTKLSKSPSKEEL